MKPLEADLYASDMGPTLLLRAREQEQVLAFKAVFEDLAAGRTTEFELGSLLIRGVVETFHAEVSERQSRYRRSLTLHDGPAGPRLRWVRARDDWRTSALLLGALAGPEGGHQYLTEEGLDDVVVRFSFREY